MWRHEVDQDDGISVWLCHADARQVYDLPLPPHHFLRVFDPLEAVGDRWIKTGLPASPRLAAHRRGRASSQLGARACLNSAAQKGLGAREKGTINLDHPETRHEPRSLQTIRLILQLNCRLLNVTVDTEFPAQYHSRAFGLDVKTWGV